MQHALRLEQRVFLRTELPPRGLEVVGLFSASARSSKVSVSPTDRKRGLELCLPSLDRQLQCSIHSKIDHLGGTHAHLHDEDIRTRYDFSTGLFWLQGEYDFLLLTSNEKQGRVGPPVRASLRIVRW